MTQGRIAQHLLELAELPRLINSDLKRGFPVHKVAEKRGWPEPLVWLVVLR